MFGWGQESALALQNIYIEGTYHVILYHHLHEVHQIDYSHPRIRHNLYHRRGVCARERNDNNKRPTLILNRGTHSDSHWLTQIN